MPAPEAFGDHQGHFWTKVQERSIVKDALAAAMLREVHGSGDDSLPAKWRANARIMPANALRTLAAQVGVHLGWRRAAELIETFLEGLPLRVVPEIGASAVAAEMFGAVLDADDDAGELVRLYRRFTADGHLDAEERRRLHEVVVRARQRLAEVDAALGVAPVTAPNAK
jgi:hypothetical protein